jgi:hypothetical protein
VRCGEGFTELPPRGTAERDALASAPAEAGPVSGAEAWTPPAHGGLAAAASSTTGAWRDTANSRVSIRASVASASAWASVSGAGRSMGCERAIDSGTIALMSAW